MTRTPGHTLLSRIRRPPQIAMSASAGIAALIAPDDIRRAAEQPDALHATPVLKLLAQAKAKNYETVCLPLTTAAWRARWRGMCLLPSGQDRDMDALAEQQAEAWRSQPAFLREEVTVTRLGERSCASEVGEERY